MRAWLNSQKRTFVNMGNMCAGNERKPSTSNHSAAHADKKPHLAFQASNFFGKKSVSTNSFPGAVITDHNILLSDRFQGSKLLQAPSKSMGSEKKKKKKMAATLDKTVLSPEKVW